MCPGLSADTQQCAASVCERETDKKEREIGSCTNKEREERDREWKIKRARERKGAVEKGVGRKEKGTAERQKASKSCMCVGSQPCQGPVSL